MVEKLKYISASVNIHAYPFLTCLPINFNGAVFVSLNCGIET